MCMLLLLLPALLQLCKEDNRDLSVCVIEKGSEVGERHLHSSSTHTVPTGVLSAATAPLAELCSQHLQQQQQDGLQ
jgi:hypothetical protein